MKTIIQWIVVFIEYNNFELKWFKAKSQLLVHIRLYDTKLKN